MKDDIEDLISQALHPPGSTPAPPSADLFSRVMESVDEDRARLGRIRRIALAWVLGVAVVVTLVLALTPKLNGDLLMPWWILELATNLALVAIAVWLGPFIKRFGRAYAADVFHDNPQTGKSYIVLTDVVYYLIFTAYILFTVRFAPVQDWGNDITRLVTPQQLQHEVVRIGGILLIIGILHGLNIVLMPVLGRLFSVNRRLPPPH